MATVFPIGDTPGTIPAPHWIEETPELSEKAEIEAKYINGGINTLQLSEVATGGKIMVQWNEISDTEALLLMNFWYAAGKSETLTLPAAFFRPEWPLDRVAFFRAISPTGNWRFASKPKINHLNLQVVQVIAELEAILI